MTDHDARQWVEIDHLFALVWAWLMFVIIGATLAVWVYRAIRDVWTIHERRRNWNLDKDRANVRYFRVDGSEMSEDEYDRGVKETIERRRGKGPMFY